MIEKTTDTNDVSQASYTAMLASIVPIRDARIQEAPVRLAQRAVQLMQNDPWVFPHQLALGMAEYRSGHYPAAEQALLASEKGANENRDGPCPAAIQSAASFYRVMALFQQGKTADAAKLLAQSEAVMKPVPANEKNPLVDGASYQDVVAWLAFKEAKALLNSASAAKL